MSELIPLTAWQKSIAIEYTPMAERIATREWKNKYNQVLSYEETQSLAYLGLVKACSHVEPGRDGLITYFERYMVGEIQEFLRRLDHAPRRIRGLINQLPEKVKITSKADVMILLQCSSKDAETILAVVGFNMFSLELLGSDGRSVNTEGWESSHRILTQSSERNDLGEVTTIDAWMDDNGLAQAVAGYIEHLELAAQIVLVLSYVEGLKLSRLHEELETSTATVHKIHDDAVGSVRTFTTGWIAAA